MNFGIAAAHTARVKPSIGGRMPRVFLTIAFLIGGLVPSMLWAQEPAREPVQEPAQEAIVQETDEPRVPTPVLTTPQNSVVETFLKGQKELWESPIKIKRH